MRILIDLQGAQNGSRDRGIGRYVRSLAHAMAREAGSHEILFLLNGLFPDQIEPVIAHFADVASRDQFIVFEGVGPVDELNPDNHWRLSVSELLYEQMVAALKPDAVLIGSLFEGSMDDTITSLGRLTRDHVVAIILYDLIPLSDPERYIGYPPAAAWYRRRVENLLRADRLLSISYSSRDEGLQYLALKPERVVRIGTATSDRFCIPDATPQTRAAMATLRARFGIDRPYIMHTSAFEERKNFEGLLEAYAELPGALRATRQLVLVCKIGTEDRARMEARATELGLSAGDMVLTGHVTDDELIAFYQNAELFVFPSFHEGFGLPALEAMACGVPTIGSNASSVPEVIGWDEAQFDPSDTDAMRCLIERALTDAAFRAALLGNAARQLASFSWEDSARAAIAAIEEAARERDTAERPRAAPLELDALAARIARIPHDGPLPELELAAAAAALAANESIARAVGASAGETPLTWRIEGPFDSSYSLALVNRETARALATLGHQVVLHSTEGPGDIPVDPTFLAENSDIAEMHAREPHIPQQRAHVTSRNLYPPRVQDFDTPISLLHSYGWEESGFPAEWVDRFNTHLSGLTVMSEHVRKLMIDNGVRIPITVTGIGVDHWMRITAAPGFPLEARGFRFLHVSSGFPRKGVDALLDAYGKAFSARDDVTLVIKTFDNPHNEVAAMLETRRRARADYPDVVLIFADLAPEDLKALYEHCHVLVAPSLAEGYGLPIAEAMLSGLPAITTGWSGQLDFANDSNAWLVDYRFERARSHFGLFTSVWAQPDVGDLARALRDAAACSPAALNAMAKIGRTQLLADHKWSDVAARLVDSVRSVDRTEDTDPPRIGWLSTWNTECGVATYSKHLTEHMATPVIILGNHVDSPIGPIDASHNCCWTASKEAGGLADVPAKLIEQRIEVLVIQFNYGFFHHEELAALIRRAASDGIAVVMMLHSTVDPIVEIPDNELFLIASSLALCDRLLVHSVADLNRLKAIGLIDTVALFPHGVITGTLKPALPRPKALPLIATFGFCLPNKGLLETVDAVALLRDRGQPVRLRMINAQFPAPVSAELARWLRQHIIDHRLSDLVEFNTDFLEDAESLALLAEADAVMFAYQKSGESASGAVRYGLAAQRPVAVTPLEIFDELGDAVFRFDGISAVQMADGLTSLLAQISSDAPDLQEQTAAAARWREQHDYDIVGRRLANICHALARERRVPLQRFQASGTGFESQVGTVVGTTVTATGQGGVLLEGPHVALPGGSYRVTLHGTLDTTVSAPARVDFLVDGKRRPMRATLAEEQGDVIGTLAITLPHRSLDVAVRITVPQGFKATITHIVIAPVRPRATYQDSEGRSMDRIVTS